MFFGGQQINRKNFISEAVKQYWQRSLYLPFFDVVPPFMKPSFTQENRSHYGRCRLTYKVTIEQDKKNKINKLN